MFTTPKVPIKKQKLYVITYQHYRKGYTLERLSSRAPRLRENPTNYATYFVGFTKTSSALESSYSELNCFYDVGKYDCSLYTSPELGNTASKKKTLESLKRINTLLTGTRMGLIEMNVRFQSLFHCIIYAGTTHQHLKIVKMRITSDFCGSLNSSTGLIALPTLVSPCL